MGLTVRSTPNFWWSTFRAVTSPDAIVGRLRAAGCVFADAEAAVLLDEAGDDGGRLDDLVVRREAGEPLEHVVGWAGFRGQRIAMRPGVFVPRPRSSLLVELAVRRLPNGATIVDLCCGSGAIAAAIVAEVASTTTYAVDCDPAAVACARENLPNAHVLLGDLFAPLPSSLRGRVTVVVVSAPYVPTDEIEGLPREARDHEPLIALDGGVDGLDVYRRVAADASRWLRSDGALIIETARHQAAAAAAMLDAAGFDSSIETDDLLAATAVIGELQPRPRRRAVSG